MSEPTLVPVPVCPCPSYPQCVPNHEHHRYGCKPHDHVAVPDHYHFWSNDDGRGYVECAFCSATQPTMTAAPAVPPRQTTPGTPATAEFPRGQDPYWAKRIAAHSPADLWRDPDAFLMHIQHEAWKVRPSRDGMTDWHHGVAMAMHLMAVHPAWRAMAEASAPISVEALALRRALWLEHMKATQYDSGHLAYGDDGEMQCHGMDYRRDPVDALSASEAG